MFHKYLLLAFCWILFFVVASVAASTAGRLVTAPDSFAVCAGILLGLVGLYTGASLAHRTFQEIIKDATR